jgi:REP element-mobilizing transposase RayT
MVRGIERRSIFVDDVDREDLLRRLAHLVPELGFRCFAWALMPNHLHLVVRSSSVRISQLMARLGTGYARRFNERHARVGHLFQNRFRSRRVYDDADLLGLVLYVTRNPLDAGLVSDGPAFERFPWCGLGALLGHTSPRPFEAVGETLALFDADLGRARQALRDRLGASVPAMPPPVATALSPHRASTRGFEDLLSDVCADHAVEPDELRSRRRTPRIAAARTELAFRAATALGLRGSEIARRLGVTSAAVSVMLARKRGAPTI